MNFGSPPVDMGLSRLAAESLRGGIHSLMRSKSLASWKLPTASKCWRAGGGGGGRGKERKI